MATRALSDISPVRGMKLEKVNLWKTKVTDLSPLEGAPLETFYAHRDVVTRNQKLLRAMKHLDTVRCPDGNGWFDQIDLNPEDNGQEIDPFAPPK